MKTYWGSGGIAPRILDLGTRWRRVVSLTPQLIYPKVKSPWYPLDRRLGGPQSRSGRGGEEKNSQLLQRLEPPIIQLVAQRYATDLSRLIFIRAFLTILNVFLSFSSTLRVPTIVKQVFSNLYNSQFSYRYMYTCVYLRKQAE
jgi:hypothetical protein